jgi:hypothetical protein
MVHDDREGHELLQRQIVGGIEVVMHNILGRFERNATDKQTPLL